MTSKDLLEALIAAHGGRERWQRVRLIEASFSSGGLAFAAHGQPFALRNLKIAVNPHGREVVLRNFGHPDWRGLAAEQVEGLRFYTRRKVFPRMGAGASPLPFPTLVWIEIDDLRISLDAQA